jgi:hypothetical protein
MIYSIPPIPMSYKFAMEDFCRCIGTTKIDLRDLDKLNQLTSFRIRAQPKEVKEEVNVLQMVMKDGMALRKVHPLDQSRDNCLAAVSQNGMALQYVINQDSAICAAALKNNGNAWPYVEVQTTELWRIAAPTNDMYKTLYATVKDVEWNYRALKYLKRNDRKLCLKVILTNMNEMVDVGVVDDPFWMPILALFNTALKYCYASPERYLKAVNSSGFALAYIPTSAQTIEICTAAIRQNPFALKYVAPNILAGLPDDVLTSAVRKLPNAISLCSTRTSLWPQLCKIVAQEANHLAYASLDVIKEMCGETILIDYLKSLEPLKTSAERVAHVCMDKSITDINIKRRLLSMLL